MAVKLPGYQAFFDSLNTIDRKRVLYLQWELLLEDFGKGQDCVALLCWHEAVDQAKAAGIGPKRNPNDETPSRVTGTLAKRIHLIDQQILRSFGGEELYGKQPPKPVVKPKKATTRDLDRETEKYFGD